jgi:hypothetical protein
MGVDGAAPRAKIKEIVPGYSFQPSNSRQSNKEMLTEARFQTVADHD